MHTAKTHNACSVAKRRHSSKANYLLLLLLLVVLAMPHRTRSQTASATGAAAKKNIPQRVVYGLVFRHIVSLDSRADLADKSGRDGSQLRNFYQRRAGLTPAQGALLRTTAHDAIAALQTVDQQVGDVIARFRAQSSRVRAAGAPVPRPTAELKTLQDAKDNAILGRLSALQVGLGASAFQRLDAYVQSAITPHVTVTTAPHAPASRVPRNPRPAAGGAGR